MGRGALIPGNPNLGVAKWRGRFYVFSSNLAAKNFGSAPDRYEDREGMTSNDPYRSQIYLRGSRFHTQSHGVCVPLPVVRGCSNSENTRGVSTRTDIHM